MDSDSRLFLVIVEDYEINMREYVVRAVDESEAKALVRNGMFMFESKPELVELLQSDVKSAEELLQKGEGQDRGKL